MPKNSALEVFASGHLAGTLARSDVEADSFIYQYDAACRAEDAISLTMPVVRDQYVSTGGLMAIFEMNLPEGALLERLRLLFAKAVPNLDDLEILALLGQSQIGRLRYARPGAAPPDVPARSLREILTYRGAEDLFGDLVNQYATYSGISGLQPKALLRASESPLSRTTLLGTTHIVKSFDPREFPELLANEYFCLRAARHAGIPTANNQLSENRRILAIERFDRRSDGSYLGFEDFCVLNGLRSHGRYQGSYEKLARRIEQFVSPRSLRAAQEQFFCMVALNCAVENGDAHLKNFAVLYEHAEGEVTLAPAYDVVATTPYMARDVLALTLAGSKQFPERKTLLAFARQHCGLSESKAAELLERARDGVLQAIGEMRGYIHEYGDFKPVGETLIGTFERGMSRLTGIT